MCRHEVVGDFYRGCGHFHAKYYTGEVTDCKSAYCRTSSTHKHKAGTTCACEAVVTDDRRVQNLFQTPHYDCQ